MATVVLRESDMRRAKNLNAKNGYGLYPEQMARLITLHQKGNAYRRTLIEYRLTDINLHNEVKMLQSGEYGELKAEIKQW